MMDILCLILIASFFTCFGFLIGGFISKPSGKLVIDKEADGIFVAITDKPEDLAKRKRIILKVYTTKGKLL